MITSDRVFETVRAKTGRALPGDGLTVSSPMSPTSDTFDSPLPDTSPNPNDTKDDAHHEDKDAVSSEAKDSPATETSA
jgi:hypothetical protein